MDNNLLQRITHNPDVCHGKPCIRQVSPEFWQMIRDRRQQPTLPLSLVEAKLEEQL